jgi:hypothetical protein
VLGHGHRRASGPLRQAGRPEGALTLTAGLPLEAGCARMGALMPEGAKAMVTPSRRMCSL